MSPVGQRDFLSPAGDFFSLIPQFPITMSNNLTKPAPGSTTAVPAGKKVAALSMGAMAIMIITNIVSMRGMASQAEYGYGSIFYYVFAALVFLVPYALVCAELASAYTHSGGLFRWCAEAFGPKWGWVAMYLEWQMVVIWFPAVLMFAAVSLAYIFWPETFDAKLATNVIYTLVVVLAVYWVATFVTFKGQKYANALSTFGGLTGTIIPAIILIALGLIYWICGHTIYIPSDQPFFPNFKDFSNIVLAASIFLFYAGMEMQAVHVPSMNNPSKNFPKACFIAVISILCIFVFCTLAIGAAVPEKDINLLQSLLVAYNKLWASIGVPWLGNVMALLITVGALAQITVVISAPSTGILAVGRAGFLPRGLQKVNKNGIQVPILWVQGIFVTVLSLVLVVMPSVESAYQVLSQMSTVLYLIMVIIIYGAFLRLRRTEPNARRGFKVPCGNFGKWFVFLLGVAGALLAMFISFVPPSQISTGSPVVYVGIILIGVCVFVAFPFIVYAKRKASWRDANNNFYPFDWQIEGREPGEVSKWPAGYVPDEAEVQKAMEEGIADECGPRTEKDVHKLF